MPETLKILGQNAPALDADVTLYTVPAATAAVVSSLTVCNPSTTPATVRVHARIDGVAVGVANAVVYDMPVGAKETVALTLGITLDAADVLSVRNSGAVCTFSAFGTEVS